MHDEPLTRSEWDDYTDDERFEYARLADAEIARYREVLSRVPECEIHGSICLPHARKWIEAMKQKIIEEVVDGQ